MGIIKRPMKAEPYIESKLRFPVLASAKIDGLRCIKQDGDAKSSSFKPIRNLHARKLISSIPYEELDGELISHSMSFRETSSVLTKHDGEPDFIYWIFDYVSNRESTIKPYFMRLDDLSNLKLPDFCRVLRQHPIRTKMELYELEDHYLKKGAEGLVIRSYNSPYKMGRSTVNEGYMLKIKRYVESYGLIIGIIEQAENQNEAEENNFGLTMRNKRQEGMVGKDTLGALRVRDVITNQEFKIGGGLGWTIEWRKQIWDNWPSSKGLFVKYKYFPKGEYDNPRHPIMLSYNLPMDEVKEYIKNGGK